jgi:hypothetical protein
VIWGTRRLSHPLRQLLAVLIRIARNFLREQFRLLPYYPRSVGVDFRAYSLQRGIVPEAAVEQAYAQFARLVCWAERLFRHSGLLDEREWLSLMRKMLRQTVALPSEMVIQAALGKG